MKLSLLEKERAALEITSFVIYVDLYQEENVITRVILIIPVVMNVILRLLNLEKKSGQKGGALKKCNKKIHKWQKEANY